MMITAATLKNKQAKEYYFITRVMQLVTSFTFACFVLIFGNIIFSNLDGWNDQLVFPLSLAIFSFLFQDYIRRELFTKNSTVAALVIDIICYGSRILALFILTINNELDIHNTLLIIAVTSSISFVYLFDKSIIFAKPSQSSWIKNTQTHWHNGKWLILNSLAYWGSSQAIMYATGFLLSAATVGRMGATQNIVGISSILFQAMENFVPSNAARIYKSGNISDLNAYLKKIALYGGAVSLTIVVIAGIFSKPLLELVYSNYTDDNWMIWFWGLYFFLGFFTRPLTAGLRVLNDTRSIFIATSVGTLITFSIGLVLIKSFGAAGSLTSICLIQLIILIILFIRYRHISLTQSHENNEKTE